MRFTTERHPAKNTMIKLKCEVGDAVNEPEEVDMTEDDNFYMLAMVDIARDDAKEHYDAKVKSLKDESDSPCPMKFLPDGISEDYVKLMRGLQFLEPIDADTLVGFANSVKQDELWVRSSINTHTPLEAAISAGFTEFGSETADQIAKILIVRGAPLIRHSFFQAKLGGPTSSPIHMLMSRGQFSRLNDLLLVAHQAGRIDGEKEKHAADLIWNDFETGSPMWHCRHSALAVKFLQSDLCRSTLAQIAPVDEVMAYRAGTASSVLRAAALGVIARDPDDFGALFKEQCDFSPHNAVAGRAIHRCVEGRAESLPVSHFKKLLQILDKDTVLAYDMGGRTVLHWAVCAGNDKVVAALVEKYPELVGMPTRPIHFDNYPSDESEGGYSGPADRAKFFEKLRRKTFDKDSSYFGSCTRNLTGKWGADSTDPATFRSPLANNRGRFAIEFATENHNMDAHNNEKLEAMTQTIAAAFLQLDVVGQNEGVVTKQEIADMLDACLANLASRKASAACVNAVLQLYAQVAPGYPRRAVGSGVLRRNKEFLSTVYQFCGSVPMNIVLDITHEFHNPVSSAIQRWKDSNASTATKRASGLRRLVQNNNASSLEQDEGSKEYHELRIAGDRVVTPVLLACLNDSDLDMARFLVGNCGCTTDAGFLAEQFNNGDFKIDRASSSPSEIPNKGNLAKRCKPYYVASVLLQARGYKMEHAEAARVFELISFLVEQNNILLTQNIDLKMMFLDLFLSSSLVLDNSFVEKFFSFINFNQHTELPRSCILQTAVVFHLINTNGFSRFDLIPKCLLLRFLKNSATCYEFASEAKDDDDYNDEEEETKPEDRSRFAAFAPDETDDAPESFDIIEGSVHPLLEKIYPRHKKSASFELPSTNELRSSLAVDKCTDGTQFCKFIVDNFWTCESQTEREEILTTRSSIFRLCLRSQLNSINNLTADSSSSPDLAFNYLMDKAEETGVTEVPFNLSGGDLSSPPFHDGDAALATRYLRLFGRSITRSMRKDWWASGPTRSGLLFRSNLARFIYDAEFVTTLRAMFMTEIDDAKHDAESFFASFDVDLVKLALSRSVNNNHDYSHILNNEELLARARKEIPERLAAANEQCLTEFLASSECEGANPFIYFIAENPRLSGNKFFNVASRASSFWFDTWCVEKLRDFFGSSQFNSNKTNVEMWFTFENFLAIIANASRTTLKADEVVNPIFEFLINTGLELLEEESDRVRLFTVLLRVVFGSSLPQTVRLLAEKRESSLNAAIPNLQQLIDDDHEAFNSKLSGGGAASGDEDEEDCAEGITFSWDQGASLILRFGGAEMLERLKVVCNENRSPFHLNTSSCHLNNVINGFVSTWPETLAQGNPLDLRQVRALFNKASSHVQSQIIEYLVKGGQYINEDALDGRAVATFMFEALACNGRISSTATIVDILDLGTRHSDDPGSFVRAYSEQVDTAVRDECALGNPTAIEVAKRCAESIKDTDEFKEKGPFRVHDNVFLYDSEIDENKSGLFAQFYESLDQGGGADEDEEDEYGGGSCSMKMDPAPFNRLVYLIQRGVPAEEVPKMSPQEAEKFFDQYFRACNCGGIDVAPAVCSAFSDTSVAARASIPRAISMFMQIGESKIDEVKKLTGLNDITAETLGEMKYGRVRVEVVPSLSSGERAWARVEYSMEDSTFIVQLVQSELSTNPVPENVALSAELEKLLEYCNAPKLFNGSL